MPKFSIILPVKNGGHYVKECVNSILSQELSSFDLHILDNNSNDGTLEWLQTLQDPRIHLYPSAVSLSMEENWARIKTIPKNEFMTMIGHDDILLPHYLDEMERLIQQHPAASLYQAHYAFINGEGNFMRFCLPMDEHQYGYEFLACHFTRSMESMGTGYMMRSKDYEALGGMPAEYPNLIFADYQLWIQLSLIGYKATTSRHSFNYRIHNNISKLTNGEQYQLAFEKYVAFIAGLMKENEKIKEVVEKYGHGMLMYYCESLSHRLLKTPRDLRKTTVSDFIQTCRRFAADLIPGQTFEPGKVFRIRIAEKLDRHTVGRTAFTIFKKISS